MRIHQVKTRLVNSYVIEDKSRLFVIDVAIRGEKYVLGYIEKIMKRDITDVDLVICTHDDPDHIGGVRSLARECNALAGLPYAADSMYLKLVNDPVGGIFKITTAVQEAFRPRAWDMYLNPGRNRAARLKPIRRIEYEIRDKAHIVPEVRLENNRVVPNFTDWYVIHTPGHTWDSCCYFHKPSKSLITGDTLLGSSKKGRLVVPSIYSNPLQMAETIKKLKALVPQNIYPGHGSFFQGENLLNHL